MNCLRTWGMGLGMLAASALAVTGCTVTVSNGGGESCEDTGTCEPDTCAEATATGVDDLLCGVEFQGWFVAATRQQLAANCHAIALDLGEDVVLPTEPTTADTEELCKRATTAIQTAAQAAGELTVTHDGGGCTTNAEAKAACEDGCEGLVDACQACCEGKAVDALSCEPATVTATSTDGTLATALEMHWPAILSGADSDQAGIALASAVADALMEVSDAVIASNVCSTEHSARVSELSADAAEHVAAQAVLAEVRTALMAALE